MNNEDVFEFIGDLDNVISSVGLSGAAHLDNTETGLELTINISIPTVNRIVLDGSFRDKLIQIERDIEDSNIDIMTCVEESKLIVNGAKLAVKNLTDSSREHIFSELISQHNDIIANFRTGTSNISRRESYVSILTLTMLRAEQN